MKQSAAIAFTLWVVVGIPSGLAAQATPEPWTLALDHRIGSLDGDASLTWVADLTVNGDTLFVLQPQDQHIALFDRGGARLGALGRAGEGPGEFRLPSAFGWHQDRLWVADSQLRAITLFDPAGRAVDRLAPRVNTGDGETFRMTGLLVDGTVVGEAIGSMQAVATGAATTSRLLTFDPTTEAVDFLDQLWVGGTVLVVQGERSSVTMSQPISRKSLYVIAPGGAYVVVAHQPVDDEAPGAFALSWIRLDGDRATRRYRRSSRELHATARDSLVDRYATMFSERGTFGTHAAARRAIERSLHLPQVLPPVTGLFIGSDHSVWVRHEEYSGRDGVEYTVVNPVGEPSGRVRVPAGVSLLASDGEKAWGRLVDELGVNYILTYTIVKPNG